MAHGEGTLRALLRTVAQDNYYNDDKIDVKEITSGGANYTSILYLATISSPSKPDLKLFAKVGCFSEKIRAKVNANRLYKTEDIIYNRLVNLWENLQEKYQVPEDRRFVFPKYYAGSLKVGSETVVLEDLAVAGYRSFNRFKSMDWEHAASAVTELAKYHALSFILEKEDPVVYGEVVKELTFQPMTEDQGSRALWEKMISGAAQVIDEQHRGKMMNFFTNATGNVYTEFHTPRGRPILVHGDYRLSNLLFRKQSNQPQYPAMAHGEGTLRALLRTVAQDNYYDDDKIDVKEITSGGANYTSILYLATISSPSKPDLKLFAKVGCFSEKIRAKVNANRMYKTEDIIYNRLVNLWENLQEKYQVPEDRRFVFPKYYAGSLKVGSETVVLEDLAVAGYRSFNRFKSMDWEHAASAVTELAKYHALSFILEKEDPVVYGEVVKELTFQPMAVDQETRALWEKTISGAAQVIDEQHRGKMMNFFTNATGNVYTEFHTPRGRPILVHGDYRLSNLLFRKQNGKLESIVLDYQTVHTGCPVTDLIYLVFMGSDATFRSQHFQELVEHYYQQLGLQLRLYQMEIDDVYPRKEFDEDMKKLLPYAILLGVIILPVVTVEAERAPCTHDDDAQLEDFIVKPNELYAERFGGLVSDLVAWGAI